MRLLLTGFDAFGTIADNPSARLVRALDGERVCGGAGTIVGAVLPVAIEGLAARLAALVDRVKPSAVLQFGVAENRRTLGLERRAVNEADFPIPDIEGAQWRRRPLLAGEPASREASLPLGAIAAAFDRAAVPWEWSDDAGRYLCNAAFFHGLALAARRTPPLPWGFVHVPLPQEENPGSAVSWGGMVQAARLAAEVMSLHLPPPDGIA